MSVFHEGCGIFAGDEIQQSSNSAQHAVDTVNNMVRNRFRWLALELESNDENTCRLTKQACQANNIGFGLWSQNTDPVDVLVALETRKPSFYIVNVETPHEDFKWNDGLLDGLLNKHLSGGYGLIYTEGAFGHDPNKTKKWRSRGFFSIPEAIESENSQATINNMMFLSAQLGWNEIDCGPSCYINKDYPADQYSDVINLTRGRFSIYRLGDIDATDWAEFAKWPRVVSYTPPSPDPTRSTTVILDEISDLADEIQSAFKPGTGQLSRATLIERIADSTDDEWYKARNGVKAALDASGA
jgi:hypothetical protein